MGGASDELGRGHAEEGEREVRFGGKRARHEPEPRAKSPGGAGDGGKKGVTPRPKRRIAVGRAAAIGGQELFGDDDDRYLKEERYEDVSRWPAVCEQCRRHAERRERQRQIVPAERVEDVDSA